MKTPDDEGGPDLPAKPKGGGAAGRLKQFQMERGLAADVPIDAPGDGTEPDASGLDDEPKKPKKPKKPKA
jgi:hypothetical protein